MNRLSRRPGSDATIHVLAAAARSTRSAAAVKAARAARLAPAREDRLLSDTAPIRVGTPDPDRPTGQRSHRARRSTAGRRFRLPSGTDHTGYLQVIEGFQQTK